MYTLALYVDDIKILASWDDNKHIAVKLQKILKNNLSNGELKEIKKNTLIMKKVTFNSERALTT